MLGVEGTKLGFGLVATGVKNLTQNTAPVISVIAGPAGGENYTENFSISMNISDAEGDGFIVAIRLNNSNYSVELTDCAIMLNITANVSCEVDIAKDLIPRPINRDDWRFEILVVDDNSSIWTASKISNYSTNNFSIWWVSPHLEEDDENPAVDQGGETEQNRALIWGIVGVVVGAVVAAGVMFRRFEESVLDEVPPPFREEE